MRLKHLLILLFVFTISSIFSSCGDDDKDISEKILGTWIVENATVNTYYKFTKSKKITIMEGSKEDEVGVYTIDVTNNIMSYTLENGTVGGPYDITFVPTVSLSGETMRLSKPGEKELKLRRGIIDTGEDE